MSSNPRPLIGMVVPLVIILFTTETSAGDSGVVNLREDVQLIGEAFASEKYPGSYGYAYYGIRYGVSKRFEASAENTDFSYISNSSRSKQGNVCPQGFLNGLPPVTGKIIDEDCLYLDVYVPPRLPNNTDAWTSMVWIHGGGFQAGTKDSYNSSSLADSVGSIVVTINYRLTAFGFLSTGDDSTKGNFGLGDCKTAIKFVHKYIEKFGGKATGITLFGQSAGATLVSAALLDPVIRDIVWSAIMFSGSVLVDLDYVRNPLSAANQVAAAAGCPVNTTDALAGCLKALPYEELQKAALVVPASPITASFGLVIDHDHLKDVPLRALQQTLDGGYTSPNIVTSYLREDAALILTLAIPDLLDPTKPLTIDGVRTIVAKNLLPRDGKPLCTVPDYALADRVMQHYNLSATDSRDDTLLKLYHLGTEALQAFPAVKEASIYASHSVSSWPSVQLIKIIYDSHYNGFHAFHAMELPYIFGPWLLLPNQTYDPRLTVRIRSMLQQVAYHGRMDGPGFLQGSQYGYNELGLDAQWSACSYDLAAMYQYWQQIANEPCPIGNGTTY
ncbi:fatty acyl-CoA hydrolase precursor, medium chain-like [Paramacrobiotus metropolitanus]|uniref:fatty acyl-CoA hydrolase precursor, medium chain-like n=1 Tax=Paramacrobiotus metropolitanus TaxID=2943436 RepID=UPI002446325F|nr:fatty acyl-CoA hydrolase precursor, medium chain-like [Paramacrobiotus metropolitanus]